MPSDTEAFSFRANFHHTLDEAPDQRHFARHCHDLYEILYISQGDGCYNIEGTEYPISDGTLFLIPPYEYHFARPSKTHRYERYMMNFDLPALPEELRDLPILGGKALYFSGSALPDFLRAAFAPLDRVGELDTLLPAGGSNLLIRATVSQILLLLSTSSAENASGTRRGIIPEVITYLGEHLSDPTLSLDGIAQRFFISKYYLCREFHEHTGVSLFTYLNTKRIALAKSLLDKGTPAAEVAEQVGYRDYSSFYRAYRKTTGSSPAWARKK